jgi:hypothetical protein
MKYAGHQGYPNSYTDYHVLRERSASKVNQGFEAQDLTNIDPRLFMEGVSEREMSGLESAVEKSRSSDIEIYDESDNEEAVLSDENLTRASEILSAMSGVALDGEFSVTVDKEDLQIDLTKDLLEALEDDLAPDEHDHIHTSGEIFVQFFAQINVIRNYNAAKYCDEKFQENATRWVAVGNSRDPPTRFLFCCPNKTWGCTFATKKFAVVKVHAELCELSAEKLFVEKELAFPCRHPGCDMRFGHAGSRTNHEAQHTWVPRQCEEFLALRCTDAQYFSSSRNYAHHMNRWHRDLWDVNTPCPVPECLRTSFPSRSAYQSHLRDTHKLTLTRVAALYGAARKKKLPVFGARACPQPDCLVLTRTARSCANLGNLRLT